MKILVLNAGSSSVKSALYDLANRVPEQPGTPLWEGNLEWGNAPEFRVRNAIGKVITGPATGKSHRAATEHLLDLFLGVELDPKKNALLSSGQDQNIAALDSRERILIIRVQEEWAIARACLNLMFAA